jgi:hypothetical protein
VSCSFFDDDETNSSIKLKKAKKWKLEENGKNIVRVDTCICEGGRGRESLREARSTSAFRFLTYSCVRACLVHSKFATTGRPYNHIKMTSRMLDNWARRSATAAAKRSAGEEIVQRKRNAVNKGRQRELNLKMQHVQQQRAAKMAPSSDLGIFLKKVNLRNKRSLSRTGGLTRVNHYPDPRGKGEKKEARNKYKTDLAIAKAEQKQNPLSQGATSSRLLHKNTAEAPESNFYVMRKEGAKTNEWAMLGIYQAEESEVDATKKDRSRRLEAKKVESYLRQQEETRKKEFEKQHADKAYWLQYELDQKAKWLQEQKKAKRESLKRNKIIQEERSKQLKEQKLRVENERKQRHAEEMKIVNRQKRELERMKEEKLKIHLQKQKDLEKVKKENALILKQREQQKKDQWAEDARIDAQWKEIIDKQERDRENRLKDMYARQHKLVAIGQQTQNNVAEEMAREEARIRRHQLAEEKRVEEKAKRALRKSKQMKEEMMKSIDAAILRKKEEEEAHRQSDLKMGLKMNSIAREKLKSHDTEIEERLEAKARYRRELIRQIAEDNARKAKARAAMDTVEQKINASLLKSVEDKFSAQNRWMKFPKAKVVGPLSQVPL